jgi:hypothetical protein
VQGHASFECVLSDISRGGAFIETAQSLPLGAALGVELQCPGAEGPLRLSAVTRWKNDRGFGVQFGPLGVRDKHRLVRLLSELREQQTADRTRASGF